MPPSTLSAPRRVGSEEAASQTLLAPWGPTSRFELHFLGEVDPKFMGGDLARDEHERHAVTLCFINAVDEVQAPWPTAAGAYSRRAFPDRESACV